MSKTDEAAAKAIDKASQAADQIATKMAELAQQYGPDVADVTLAVARIAAIQELITPVVVLFLCGILFCVASPRAVRMVARSKEWNDHYFQDGETKTSTTRKLGYACPNEAALVGLCVASVVSAVLSLMSFVKLLNIWAWVGIFEPKIYIAHRVLEKLL